MLWFALRRWTSAPAQSADVIHGGALLRGQFRPTTHRPALLDAHFTGRAKIIVSASAIVEFKPAKPITPAELQALEDIRALERFLAFDRFDRMDRAASMTAKAARPREEADEMEAQAERLRGKRLH